MGSTSNGTFLLTVGSSSISCVSLILVVFVFLYFIFKGMFGAQAKVVDTAGDLGKTLIANPETVKALANIAPLLAI